jgi:hypothetical protein
MEGGAVGHKFERDPLEKGGMKLKKIFSSETTEPISTKLC